MSSSCLSGGGGRTYGFELVDIIKSPCPSPSAWSSHSSSPSSTLSDSSNTPLTISTKRARAPRKRPNQSYSEAAALLSTIYPNLFSTTHLHKLNKHHHHRAVPSFFPPDPSSALLLPPFPPLSDSAVLIRDPSPDSKPSFQFGVKPVTPIGTPANSPSNSAPADPSFDDEFDAGSILDEEVEEGIDSIMGNLSMDNRDGNSSLNSHFNPYLGSLMGFGLAGKFELGFGFRLIGNVRQALRRANDENADWWRSRTVAVGDIVPNVKASTPAASPVKKTNKKKKKKVEKEEAKEDSSQAMAAKGDIDTGCIDASASPSKERLKDGLGLTLNYEEVVKAWSDGGSPFNADGAGSPESSAELIARLAEVELFPDTGGGVREASVQRYKEKRRTRLFSKKIRYQVRKVNADRRPRMKGRFVRRPSLLHQAIEDESS